MLVKDGEVIGEGFTQPAGQDHAEIHALKDARSRGHDLRGATAYVTLEPCSHFGRTPPCANALIEAQVARVVAAMEDPNPQVSGRGLAHAARRRHRRALRTARQRSARTEYRLRLAHDARPPVGAHEGRRPRWTAAPACLRAISQWITGEAARADGHAWRARACAILTGIGTVAKTIRELTVRAVDTPRQPQRVLIDSQLDVPPERADSGRRTAR